MKNAVINFSFSHEKLLKCIQNQDHTSLQMMLEKTTSIDIVDSLGRTPLHLAVETGDSSLVKLLLEHPSVNVDREDKYGRTPLYLATANGYVQIVQLLLAEGACIKKVV